MNRVIVQVPMTAELKNQAEIASRHHGFSSLQEAIRLLLHKLPKNEISLRVIQDEDVVLSQKAKKRYDRLIAEIEAGKNIVKTNGTDDFLAKLRS